MVKLEGMPKTYVSHLDVRGYELDSFGHVNHAVYVSYLEHARWELLASENVTLAKFNEWKRWPVIARIEVDYLKPTFMGDRLAIESRIVETGKTNFTIEQQILRGDLPVLRARVRVVLVDERGRPAAGPPEVMGLWKETA